MAELARKPNPKATAEIKNKAMWAPKSGVRGNPTPDAVERKAMRTAHSRAKLDFLHIEGCDFRGVADRFQNSVGQESKAGIAYSRSILGAGRNFAWCLKADVEWADFEKKKKEGYTAKTMKKDERAKAWGHRYDIKFGQDSWEFLLT